MRNQPSGRGRLGRLRVVEVAEHHVVAAQRDLSDRLPVGRHVGPVVGDHPRGAGDHVADALPGLEPGLRVGVQPVPLRPPVADHRRAERLGQPVEVGDVEAELAHPAQDRRRRRRAAGGDPDRPVEPPGRRRVRQHRQHGRRALEVGDPLLPQQSPDLSRLDPAQADVGGPGRRHRPREAPAVAVEHRQRPQVHRRRGQAGVPDHRQRLQVGAAVVVHHALRPAGGAGGVVHRQQRPLVVRRARPRPGGGQRVLVLGPGPDPLDRQLSRRRLDQLVEVRVVHEHGGPAVLEDVPHLAGRQPGVHRDQRDAGPGHPEVGLQQHVRVRRQHRDRPAAGPLGQRTGQPAAAVVQLRRTSSARSRRPPRCGRRARRPPGPDRTPA